MKLNLGNQIRINRRRMNLTQEQLAEQFGTSPQAVSRWENGSTYPDIEMLPMIASFFDTSIDALLGCTEEEKQKFCSELQKEFEAAVQAKDIEKSIELMREIRRNLKDYQSYWFWGLYNEIWKSQIFKDEIVLNEIRLLTEEVFAVCPRETHFAVIRYMSYMEDDEHIDSFLKMYSNREDMSSSTLLFERYKMRGEFDKAELIRQYVLWQEIEHITTAASDWDNCLGSDPEYFIWFCETQLNYLNAINCLNPDKKHIISGAAVPDIWCEARILLGLRYTASLAKLGKMDEAYESFEDMIALIEQVMAISDDTPEIGCSSPALNGFKLKSDFYWVEDSGIEYRNLCMSYDEWEIWIIPHDYKKAVENHWFDSMRADNRFDALFDRLDKCVMYRKPIDR